MIRLFAGIGPEGEMRFIGEVARGSACGCRCPECNSPLIAKQGNEKEWHFAHESGQERPECHVGAANMLRRLAVEHLASRDPIVLPPYRVTLRASSPLGGRTETVEWSAQFQGSLTWLPKGPRSAPVATGRLDSGVDASLFLEIGDTYTAVPNSPRAMAAIDFVCPVPPLSDLRVRAQAEQQIQHHGRFQWRSHPDSLGLAAAAQERLNARAAQDVAYAKQVAERNARDAKSRLQSTAQLASDGATPRASSQANVDYPWAPLLKPTSSFVFYRLKDGSAWVVYMMVDDKVAIAPWPKEDGWDEALPPSVGVADEALGVYRGRAYEAVMIFFGQRTLRMRATRDPREFAGL